MHNMHDILIDLFNSLSAVRDLSELDSQAFDEKELIARALKVLIQNQDMERCSFFLFDGNEFLINVTGLSNEEQNGIDKAEYNSLKFRIGEGIIGIAAQTRELQQCDDCRQDDRFFNDSHQSADCIPGSLISAPVIIANQLIGVLNISHPEANYFSEWHVRLLQIYKNMLGQLIANYRLLQKMEEQISIRTVKLEKALQNVKQLKEQYESLSMVDDLTGLFNRRYFYTQIEMAISSTRRYGNPLCLLILDLDFFKKINDSYGHNFGDQVLRDVAISLKKEMRESDLLVRFGGEEFIVVFNNTDCQNGKIFADRIRKQIASLIWQFDEKQLSMTVSIGIFCLESDRMIRDDLNIDKIINYADIALYSAKINGRNQVVVYSNKLQENNRDDNSF